MYISNIFKGMLIGVANVIPGVSGGTMAFVLGIYTQLTESIAYFMIRPEKRKEYILFLSTLGIGIIIGLLVFAKLISYLLGVDLPQGSELPFSYVPTFGFFLGLIIGSIPILFKIQSDIKVSTVRLFLFTGGVLCLFLITSLKDGQISNEASVIIKDFGLFKITGLSFTRMIWLFIVGIIAAFTMVIPGISGSALLVALGEYGAILHYISERMIIPLGIIGVGVGIGIILATYMMSKLFEKYPGHIFYVILGLTGASCVQIFIHMISAQANIFAWLVSIVTTLLGAYVAFMSSKLHKN